MINMGIASAIGYAPYNNCQSTTAATAYAGQTESVLATDGPAAGFVYGAQQVASGSDISGALLPNDATVQDDLLRSKAEAKVMQGQFEGACHTCKGRMYQDGSNDPGVSFRSAANIDPNIAASVVMGHEMEHVAHEQAKVELEGGKIVSQSVVLHTGICPECGRTYVSGGTTRTVSRSGGVKAYTPAGAESASGQVLNGVA